MRILIVITIALFTTGVVWAQEPARDYLAVQTRAQIAAANELYSIRIVLTDLTRVQFAAVQEVYRTRVAVDTAATYRVDIHRRVLIAAMLLAAALVGGVVAVVGVKRG